MPPMLIPNVDRYHVAEPLFEGARIVLNHLGETFTPAYIQGISGAAFRIAGPCPCAPTVSCQMHVPELLKLLGYECTSCILGWNGDVEEAGRNMQVLIPRIKESICAGRPVLLWYAFLDTAFEVVVGFDDADGTFVGRHPYQKPGDDLARAKQTRAQECAAFCPALGAIFIGRKTGSLDARAAEIAAIKEAVRHAHDQTDKTLPGREGLRAYGYWVERFQNPQEKRSAGDSHCHQIYHCTHRAASNFLSEIAQGYPGAHDQLVTAASEFAAEADALDEAAPLINWSSPEADPARNADLWPLLAEARDRYAAAIGCLEQALPRLA